MARMAERKYEVCVFTVEGKVMDLQLSRVQIDKLMKSLFGYFEHIPSEMCVIKGSKSRSDKYQKKIANHWVLVDEDGRAKGLAPNPHVLHKTRNYPFQGLRVVEYGSEEHKALSNLPIVLKPLLGTVMTREKYEEELEEQEELDKQDKLINSDSDSDSD